MAINITGAIVISIFYLAIFLVGIWTAWQRRKLKSDSNDAILAGRSIGCFIGLMTLTATWVGGGYINGSAEKMYTSGLLWCQAPFGYSLSLTLGNFFGKNYHCLITQSWEENRAPKDRFVDALCSLSLGGGLFFARKMRDAGYVTMLDPLQIVFGRRWGSFLFFPALAGEMLWTAAILSALGTTLVVMIDLPSNYSIIISAAIAVTYTLFGGLAAVAYTDVIQMFCIFFGLWLTIPFAIQNEAVGSLDLQNTNWLGSIKVTSYEWGEWSDYYALLILGGIPWQVYFQRVLSSKSSNQARCLSIAASIGCIIMVIPACLIGIIGRATDWEATSLNRILTPDDHPMILPLVIRNLTPTWIAYMGLGAVSAAVMSSADSAILSSSSMFVRNIYRNVFRQKASEKELMIVMRISFIVFAGLSCVIAINAKSVYDLFYLCGDLVYVMLFPQLTIAVHAPKYVNIYGSVIAYFLGLFLRIAGGETVVGIKPLIIYPWYDHEKDKQLFPFRTLAMLSTLVSLLIFSWLARQIESIRSSKSMTVTTSKGIDNPSMVSDNQRELPFSSQSKFEMHPVQAH